MYTPLRGKVLVEIISSIKKTDSGLILADNAEDIPHRGRITALGKPFIDKNNKTHEWDIKENEVVHFKRNWDNQKNTHYVLRREDIYAVERCGTIFAVNDLTIVRRIYTGKIGNSSIIIPETFGVQSNYEEYYGEVISVGINDKFGISIGDKLIYGRNEGLSVKLTNGEEYFSLKPRAIMARIS